MSHTHHVIKRSFHHPVVVIDDLFLFEINEHQQKQIIKKWMHCLHETIKDHHLIGILYPCALEQLSDVVVDMHLMYNDTHIIQDLEHKPSQPLLNSFKDVLDDIKSNNQKPSYNDMIAKLNDYFLTVGMRLILSESVREFHRDVYVSLKVFDVRLLYQLNPKIIGFVITKKKLTDDEISIASAYGIKIIDKTYDVTQEKRTLIPPSLDIKKYLKAVDIKGLKRENTKHYEGVVFYSEYMFMTSGLTISASDICHTYQTIFQLFNQKEICIVLPNFTDHFHLPVDEHLKTEINQFSVLHPGLKNWLKGLTEAINMENPHITLIIPNINSQSEIAFWQHEIELIKSYINNDEDVQIGMMMETEASLQYCEDFEPFKVVILRLDALMNEYDISIDQQDSKEELKLFYDDLKHAHYHFRVIDPKKHIISGRALTDPKLLNKLIHMGFKAFETPIEANHE